jgi:hypothetical protein
MVQKKFLVGLAAMALVFGLAVLGCDSSGDDSDDDSSGGGGGLNVPANLQNTSWTGSYETLTFTATTVTRADGRVYTIASAEENGKIVLNDPRGGTKPLCDSYTVTSTTLILTGGDLPGTYTKDNSSGGGGGTSITITGTAKVGETLTVTYNGFTPIQPKWWSSSSNPGNPPNGYYLSGASGSTYTLKSSDEGDYIWVEAYGTNKVVISNVVGPIEAQ